MKMLESFVIDFREDPESKRQAISFGVEVRGKGTWNVQVDGKGGVEIREGLPSNSSFYYITDLETLRKIYVGEIAAFTAMGKARGSDFAPMDIAFMEGFKPSDNFYEIVTPFTFHFWTKPGIK